MIECRDPHHSEPCVWDSGGGFECSLCMQECSPDYWFENGVPWNDVKYYPNVE